MDEITRLFYESTRPARRNRRIVSTAHGTVISYVTGSNHRKLVGRASKGTTEEKFLARVNKTDTCWLWTGSIDPDGYGKFYAGKNDTKKYWFAHRWAYTHWVGKIPKDLVIDHLAEKCKNRNCVNPEHLEPTTGGDNVSRGHAARRAQQTHCINLHAYAIVGRNADLSCKQCQRDSVKAWSERNNTPERREAARLAEAARRAAKRDEINERRRNKSPEEKERVNKLRRDRRNGQI